MPTHPQAPGGGRAPDGGWSPPQPPQAAPYQQYTQQPAPARRTRNRGCVVAVVVAVAFVLIGGGIGADHVYRGGAGGTPGAGGPRPSGGGKGPPAKGGSRSAGG